MITISYSGGRGSAASVLLAEKLGLEYEWVFADTLIEDDDLYRFTEDLRKKVSGNFIKLTDGRTPWDVFSDEKYIGDTRIAPCSRVLKTKQVRRYMKQNNRRTLVLGMAGSEADRILRARKSWEPVEVRSLLIENGVNTSKQIDDIIKECGLTVPRLYDMGFPHNNCGGFLC